MREHVFFAALLTEVLAFAFLSWWNWPLMQKWWFQEVDAVQTIPKVINYQARITDSAGVPVPDGALNVKFVIYDAPTGGTCLYTAEGSCGTPTTKSVTVSNGNFSTLIGEAGDNTIPDNLFDNNALYLGIAVGSDAEMSPRKRIGASGYAFNADRLDNLDTSSSGGAAAYVPVTDSSGGLYLSGLLRVAGAVSPATNLFQVQNGNDSTRYLTVSSTDVKIVGGYDGNDVVNQAKPLYEVYDSGGTRRTTLLAYGGQTWVVADSTGAERGSVNIGVPGGVPGVFMVDSSNLSRSDMQLVTGGGFDWRTGSGATPTEHMRLDANGNLGIGTNNPGTLLNVGDGATQSNVLVTVNGPGSANYNGFRIDTAGTQQWFIGRDGTDSTDDLIFRADSLTNVMRVINTGAVANTLVLSAGKIGLGHASPTSFVDMRFSGAGTGIARVQNTHNTGYSSVDYFDNSGVNTFSVGYGNTGVGGGSSILGGRGYIGTSSGTDLLFTNAGAASVIFKSGGNVGIGTIAPTAKLVVQDPSASPTGNIFQIANANDSTRYLTVSSTSTTIAYGLVGGGAPALSINDSTAPAGFLQLGDATSASNQYLPQIYGKASSTGATNRSGLKIIGDAGEDGTDDEAVIIQGRNNSGGALVNANTLEVWNSAQTALLTVDPVGQLGINTSSPSYALDIQANTNAAVRANITNLSSGTGASSFFQAVNNLNDSFQAGIRSSGFTGTGAPADFSFVMGNSSGLDLLTLLSDPIIFETTDTERMRILSTGEIGIGTSAPTAKLTLRDASANPTNNIFQVSNANDSARYMTVSSTATLINPTASSSYQVGIGTTSPSAVLEISGAAGTNPDLHISDGDVSHGMTSLVPTNVYARVGPFSSTAGGAVLSGFSDADSLGAALWGHIGSSDPTDTTPAVELRGYKQNGTSRQALGALETVLGVNNAGGSNLLVVLGGGNVGIGNVSPTEKLDLLGTSASGQSVATRIQNTTANGYEGVDFYNEGGTRVFSFAHSNTSATVLPASSWLGTRNAESLHFVTNGTTPRLTIDTSGNVGINWTNPGAKLVVADGSASPTNNIFQVTNANDSTRYLTVSSTSTLINPTVSSSYQVGIGTTAPDAFLHIANAISTSNNLFEMTDTTASGGYLKITDGTSIANQFIPTIKAKGIGTGFADRVGLFLLAEPGEDGSDDGAFILDGRLGAASLVNAPIVRVQNNGTVLAKFEANGDFDVNTNNLYVDASANSVGIGTSTPSALLAISSTSGSMLDLNRTATSPGEWRFNITNDPIGTGGIYSNGSMTILGQTAGVDFGIRAGNSGLPQLSVLDTGNVGVGSTSPTARLVVADASASPTGNILQISNANDSARYLTVSSTSTQVTSNQNGTTIVNVVNPNAGTAARAMFSANNGTGGLGVEVFGSGWTPALTLDQPNYGYIGTDSALNGLVVTTGVTDPLIFGTSNAERMRIDGNGNVGIGTAPNSAIGTLISYPSISLVARSTSTLTGTNPTMGIEGDLGSSPSAFNRTFAIANNGTSGNVVRLGFNDNTAGQALSQIESFVTGGNSGVMTFRTQNSGTMAERMRIDNAGNVGINTTSPVAGLEVVNQQQSPNLYGNIFSTVYGSGAGPGLKGRGARGTSGSPTATQTDDYLMFFGGNGYTGSSFTTNSSAFIGIQAAENFTTGAQGGYLSFYTSPTGGVANAQERMVIGASGNVGIGDTTPASLLTVGNGDLFQVDSSGNPIKIRNVTYSWPSSQAASSGYALTNDGSGNLSWAAAGVSTLQGAYNGSTSPELTLDATRGALTIRDAGAAVGNLLELQNSNNSAQYLTVSSTETQITGANGSSVLSLTTTSGSLTDSVYMIANGRARFGYDGSRLATVIDDDGIANKNIVLDTSGSERLRITNTGNVGIGTTSPANKLDVEGGAAIGASYSGSTSAPTNGLIVQGSVGIGTSGPGAYQLSVVGGDAQIASNDTTLRQLRFDGTGSAHGGKPFRISFSDGQYADDELRFVATGIGVSAFAFMDSAGGVDTAQPRVAIGYDVTSVPSGLAPGSLIVSGDVGIGTTSPSSRLTVSDSLASPTNNIFQVSNANDSARYLTVSSTSTLINPTNVSGYDVGIGTSSPSAQLHLVKGTPTGVIGGSAQLVLQSDTAHALQFTGCDACAHYIDFANTGSSADGRLSFNDSVADGFSFYTAASGLVRLVITGSGDVGVGTTAPGARLTVRDGSASPTTNIFQVSNSTDSARYFTVNATSTHIYGNLTLDGTCTGCGGSTLQSDYNSSTSPELTLDGTRGALTIRDAGTAVGNLLELQNDSASKNYFTVSSTSTTIGTQYLDFPDVSTPSTTAILLGGSNNISAIESHDAANGIGINNSGNPNSYINFSYINYLSFTDSGASTAFGSNFFTLAPNSLTTGSGISLTTSSASLNSTNGVLYVANTTSSTSGVLARLQSNSTTGSGLTVLASGNVGVGTASPFALLTSGIKSPASVGFASTGSNPQNVVVQDNYAYTANLSSGDSFSIVDVSNPASPTLKSTTSTGASSGPKDIFVQGRYAYIALRTSQRLAIYDVSNPSGPSVTGTVGTTGSNPTAVYVQGRYAYVVNNIGNTFDIFDVGDPSTPYLVSSTSTGASSNPSGVYVHDKYAYITMEGSSTFKVYDVSNPASMTLTNAGTVSTGTTPREPVVVGKYLYLVTNTSNRLEIYDVSSPTSPSSVSNFTVGSAPNSVFIQGRYAYVANNSGSTLQVVDVSTPSSPSTVYTVSTVDSFPSYAYVQGRYAYVSSASANRIRVFDLGGEYTQQFEAGGISTTSLSVSNALYALDANFKGGLNVGHNAAIFGSLGVKGGGYFGGSVSIGAASSTADLGVMDTTTAFGTVFSATGTALTSGKLLQLVGGTAMTTGNVINVATATFATTGSGNVGKVMNMQFALTGTDANSNGAYGISITPQFDLYNTSAHTKALAGINIDNPTYTNCAVGTGFRCAFYGAIIGGLGTSFTHTTTDDFVYDGLDINQEANSFTQSNSTGSLIYTGLSLRMPTMTQTAGTAEAYGVRIYASTYTGGVSKYWALNMVNSSGADSAGIDANGSIYADIIQQGNSFALCHTTNGTANLQQINDCAAAPSSDYMEMYPAAPDLAMGDIVMPGDVTVSATNGDQVPQVVKTDAAYKGTMLGVISNPADAGDFNSIGYAFADSVHTMPVALKGRVKVKVNTQNGPIKVGDGITSSDTPGVGMKSTKPGMIVGQALQAWDGPGQGTILVFMGNGWNDGQTIGTDGTMSLFQDDFAFDKTGTASSATPGSASRSLLFRGSAWDLASSTAVNRDISILNSVTDENSYALTFKNNDNNILAALSQNGDLALAGTLTTNGGFDYAEMFPAVSDLDAGDLVMADGSATSTYGVKKSDVPYENALLGIISTKPGLLAGGKDGSPVALAGRVPAKVSTENGPIKVGDPITSSSQPGVGMKATEAGRVVGIALQAYDASGVGTITVFVNPSWYNGPAPASGQTTTGGTQLTIQPDSIIDFQHSTITNLAAIVSSSGNWSVTDDGYLIVKHVDADSVKSKIYTAVQTNDSQITGEGSIPDGSTAAVIHNDLVKPNSRVFVSFLGDPHAGYWIGEKGTGDFTVHLSVPATGQLDFEYWILDVEDQRTSGSPADSGTSTLLTDPAPTDSGSSTSPVDSGSTTSPVDSGTSTSP